ncbi:MAG TPA: DUF1257 domain-containing protein [Pirellulaceae bacterium]|nr:DUF1257 domain-containing protein [Pirellulaceae bacterium]
MSHIVTVQVRVRSAEVLGAACRRLGIGPPISGRHPLYAEVVEGLGVSLPNFRYPVVFRIRTGQVVFDDFEGRWGDRRQLDRLLQSYAIEQATSTARRQGYAVVEQARPDGSVRLELIPGGPR